MLLFYPLLDLSFKLLWKQPKKVMVTKLFCVSLIIILLSLISFLCDNQSTIKLTKNPIFCNWTKYFSINVQFVQQLVKKTYSNAIFPSSS
jgi:hypothetical protein